MRADQERLLKDGDHIALAHVEIAFHDSSTRHDHKQTLRRLGVMVAAPQEEHRFDEWDPANVSPLVAWLASEACTVTGQVFYTFGGTIAPMTGWTRTEGISHSERWSIADIDAQLRTIL